MTQMLQLKMACFFFSFFIPVLSFAGFDPRLGDEARYEVSVPTSSGIATKTVQSYKPAEDSFEISIEQDNGGGRIQKRIVESPRAQVEAQYIENLTLFCQNHQGELRDFDLQGKVIKTCLVTKDDRVFKQQTWWAEGIPFGVVLAVKESPLHPKASTTTKLLSFKRGSLP